MPEDLALQEERAAACDHERTANTASLNHARLHEAERRPMRDVPDRGMPIHRSWPAEPYPRESRGTSFGSGQRVTGVGSRPVAGDVEYAWHAAPVPERLVVTQVYGWLLDDTGRCLVQIHDDGHANLPGGSPEPGDVDWVDTLRREAMEENQVVVGDAVFLGYEEVRRSGREPYAQVRMAGLITEFQERRPDPDGGQIYRRYLTPLPDAARVLGWGRPGDAQASAAAEVAAELWQMPVRRPSAEPGFMD